MFARVKSYTRIKAALAYVATLALAASALALTATPAVALPAPGIGHIKFDINYPSGLPLSTPAVTSWDIISLSGTGTFNVRGETWSGSFDSSCCLNGSGSSNGESYLTGGSGGISFTGIRGTNPHTGAWFDAGLSASYNRDGSKMVINVFGQADLCAENCHSGIPIAFTVNAVLYADPAVICSSTCIIEGTYMQTAGTEPVSYPSDGCGGVGSTGIFDGYAGDTFARLRTAPNPNDASSTWVCTAADDGTRHLGGKIEIAGSVGLPDPQPGQGLACSASPQNIPVRSGTVAGGQPYRLDITPSPGGANEVWVCVQATTSVDYRIVIHTVGVAIPGFELDIADPHPAYASPISPGAASSYCQANGGTRLLNAEINGSRVWLYTKQASATKADVCVRSQAAATGKKITLDGAGGPVSIATTNLPQCTAEVISDNGPPPFSIFHSPAGSVPAAACVKVGTSYVSIKADPNSGIGVVTQTSD